MYQLTEYNGAMTENSDKAALMVGKFQEKIGNLCNILWICPTTNNHNC